MSPYKEKFPFIIAELSGNHNGDINRAFALMEDAKQSGADAVKLQTYTADTMTIDCDKDDFIVKGGLWDGRTLYELYQEAQTPWEWHKELFAKGQELGITVFSTPFDNTAVDFLEQLGTPIYKIASFELVDLPLIKYVATTKKPMIMSTGMASINEIEEAVQTAVDNGCQDLTLLHCVSAYPADIKDCNLATMVDLQKRFPSFRVGLSDHTLGTTVAIAAVALGAQVIEKHITLARADGGVDSAFSLEPDELAQLCSASRDAWNSVGRVTYNRSKVEQSSKVFRRSIYAVQNIKKGEKLTKDNIKIIRPGYGIAPKYYEEILGKIASNDIFVGDRIVYDSSILKV